MVGGDRWQWWFATSMPLMNETQNWQVASTTVARGAPKLDFARHETLRNSL